MSRLLPVPLLLTCAVAVAAPVPPHRVRALTPDLLPGEWVYDWGTMARGSLLLLPGGEYLSRHRDAPGEWDYEGYWSLDGADLVLSERQRCPAAWGRPEYREYRVRLSAAAYPTITGTSETGARVVLSAPRRFAD